MKKLILFISFLVCSPLSAQSLSLDEAMQTTRDKNPDLKAAEADVKIAEGHKNEVLAAHIPHVGVQAQHIFNQKYEDLNVNLNGSPLLFPSGIPQTAATLEASLNIFDGFSTIYRYRAAQLETDAAKMELEDKRFKSDQTIRRLYFEALAAQILVDVSDENIKSLQEHLSLARAQQNSGYATRFDSLRVEAQLEEAQAERMLNVDNMILARRSLAREMGLENDARPLVGKLPTPPENLPKDLGLDVAGKREYQARVLRESAAQKDQIAAHGGWYPQVSLYADQTYYKFGSFDPVVNSTNYQSAYSVGLRLNWELWDGGTTLARSKMAAAAHAKAEQNTRREMLDSGDDFERWQRRFNYNVALYHARVRLVEKSNESVRLAHVGLKAGVRTSSDSLDAELELFKSRAGLVKANLDALNSLIQLEVATGHPLSVELKNEEHKGG